MRKLLLITLVCAMGLGSMTSCVKTEESASVTNIRNQKAEQLKSLAALNNAKAEAEKTLADANAKVLAAEAAYQQALADAKKLENEEKQIAIDKAKATLALEIEAAKLNAEAAVKLAQKALEIAKAELITAMDGVSEAEKSRITTLISKATIALNGLNTAKQSLVDKKSDKISAEYDLIDLKRAKENAISSNNNDIAYYKSIIAELEKLSTSDKTETEKAMNETYAKYLSLDKLNDDANVKHSAAISQYNLTLNNMNNCRFMVYANNNTNYIESKNYSSKNKEFIFDDGQTGSTNYYGEYTLYSVKSDLLSSDIAREKRDVTIAETTLKEVEKVLAEKIKTQEYKDLVKALDDAKKEFEEAETSAEKQQAQNKIDAAQIDLKNATINEERDINQAKATLTSRTENVKYLNNLQNILTGEDATAYLALVENYKTATDKVINTNVEALKTNHNSTVQWNVYQSLVNIYNNLTDYPAEILNHKESITELEKDNADYRDVNTKEALIAKYNSEIANLESEIKVLEKTYNDYKAQIDALTAAK